MKKHQSIKLLVLAIVGSLLLSGCHHRKRDLVQSSDGAVWRGMSSWYGRDFHGRSTASGERYNMHAMTAAHRTLPFGTVVEVKNRKNGRRVRVRINDRGPFVRGRIIDLSYAAARQLGMVSDGIAPVEIRLLRNDPKMAGTQELSCFAAQVGSFRRRSNAERLHRDLQELIPSVHLERSSDRLWTVRVGCYATREEANATAALLRQRGYDSFVVRTAVR